MKKTALLLVLAMSAAARAQDSVTTEISNKVDERGDAQIEVQFQLSAKAWMNWKARFGDHPDMLRRDLMHQFSMFEVADYDLKTDNMNRKAVASIKARGAARYKGNGKFEIDLPGDWKKVTDTGREWHFSQTSLAGQNVMMTQINKITLPEGSRDARLGAVQDNQQILSYTLPQKTPFSPWPFVAGAGLIGPRRRGKRGTESDSRSHFSTSAPQPVRVECGKRWLGA